MPSPKSPALGKPGAPGKSRRRPAGNDRPHRDYVTITIPERCQHGETDA
ncbi:hypothetical protein ACNFH5_24385 [Pseudomonas sp. NY15435]